MVKNVCIKYLYKSNTIEENHMNYIQMTAFTFIGILFNEHNVINN